MAFERRKKRYPFFKKQLAATLKSLSKVSISSTLKARIFRTNAISAAFFCYMYAEKAAKTTFIQKSCS
jgi:hypothetical protein